MNTHTHTGASNLAEATTRAAVHVPTMSAMDSPRACAHSHHQAHIRMKGASVHTAARNRAGRAVHLPTVPDADPPSAHSSVRAHAHTARPRSRDTGSSNISAGTMRRSRLAHTACCDRRRSKHTHANTHTPTRTHARAHRDARTSRETTSHRSTKQTTRGHSRPVHVRIACVRAQTGRHTNPKAHSHALHAHPASDPPKYIQLQTSTNTRIHTQIGVSPQLPPRAWHVHAESVTPHSNECVPQERETIPRMLVRTQRLPLTSCVPKSGTGRTCTRSLKLRAAHRPRRTRRSTYPLRSQRARGQRCARRSSRNAAAGLTGCVSRVPHTGRMCTGVT